MTPTAHRHLTAFLTAVVLALLVLLGAMARGMV